MPPHPLFGDVASGASDKTPNKDETVRSETTHCSVRASFSDIHERSE
jgi:hypothetical protein